MDEKTSKYDVYISTFLLLYLNSGFGLDAISGTLVLILDFALLVFMLLNNIKSIYKIQLLPVICLLIAITSYLVNGEETKQIIILVLHFLVAMYFCCSYPVKSWTNAYVTVISLISICSLALYFINIVAPSTLEWLPPIYNSIGLKKGTILLAVTPSLNRNYGCFWEPGAFQTYIIIAFIIEFFCFGIKSKKRFMVLLLALVTTFSTAGYISATICTIAVLISSRYDNSKKRATYYVVLLIVVAVFVAYYIINRFYPQLAYVLFGKLENFQKTKNSNSSTGVRVNSIIETFRVFMQNPVFGVGKTHLKGLFRIMYGHEMVTCTYANWFAYFGLLFGLLMLFGLYCFVSIFSERASVRIMLFFAMIASITSEDYVINPSVLILIFYGYANCNLFSKNNKMVFNM